MRIHTLAWLLALNLAAAGPLAAADPPADAPDQPLRLKKKGRPPSESTPEKDQDKEKEKAGTPRNDREATPPEEPVLKGPAQDAQEIAGRVVKNMRASDERLAASDAGDATRQVQRDILKDLDALLEQARQQQEQQSSSSSQSSSRDEQQMRRQRSARNRASQRPKPEENGLTKEQQEENGAGGGARRDAKDPNRIADLYKDIWGHLPATLRQEMDQYAREQFMAKYSELLKQYYATLAEKGRRREAAPNP